MLQQILHLTGLEAQLLALKARIETRAQRAIDHGKAVAIQTAIAAALGVGALIVALMAFAVGLIALFLWLEPRIGDLAAVGAVAGVLVAVALALVVSATVLLRREVKVPATKYPEATMHNEAKYAVDVPNTSPAAATPAPVTRDAVISRDEVRSVLATIGTPKVGIEPIDQLVQTLAPKAEEATAEAIGRAANVVRHGDRPAMLAVLGTALAIGWLIGSTNAASARRG